MKKFASRIERGKPVGAYQEERDGKVYAMPSNAPVQNTSTPADRAIARVNRFASTDVGCSTCNRVRRVVGHVAVKALSAVRPKR